MGYWEWNNAISGHFFKEEYAGRTVVLYFDRALIDAIGKENKLGGWTEYIAAIKAGPEGLSRLNYPLELMQQWQSISTQSGRQPYFMALLGLLVVAWTEREEGQNSYYGAFEDLLKEEGLKFSSEPYFLALDLVRGFALIEAWCREQGGSEGMCYDEKLHVWRYVGRIKYHALLRPEERRHLHYIWAEKGLNRNASPSPHLLILITLSHAKAEELIPGILSLARNPSTKIQLAVQELLSIDFQNWDGKYSDPSDRNNSRHSLPLEIHLCMNRKGQTGLRLYHPDVSGSVSVRWGDHLLKGEIGEEGWSEWLRSGSQQATFHPDPDQYSEPQRLSTANGIRVNYHGGTVIKLAPAESLGASGTDYVSTQLWDRDRRNLVLSQNDSWQEKVEGTIQEIPNDPLNQMDWQLWEVLPLPSSNGDSQQPVPISCRLKRGRKNHLGHYSLHALPCLSVKGLDEKPVITISTEVPYQNAMHLSRISTDSLERLYSISFAPDYQPSSAGDSWTIAVEGIKELTFTVAVRMPLRQYSTGQSWFFSAAGEQVAPDSDGISHAKVKVSAGTETPALDKFYLEHDGLVDAPPFGFEFPERLLEAGSKEGVVPYGRLFQVITDWASSLRGYDIDPIEVRQVRQRLAAMGYYFAIPEKRIAQLAPPALVRLPENLYRIRFLLTGIWTRPLLLQVRKWCELPENGIRMVWEEQQNPVLPPMAILETADLDNIMVLVADLAKRFPGYVQCTSNQIYSLELLRFLEMADHDPKQLDENGVIRVSQDEDEAFLNPETLSFSQDFRPRRYPAISMSRHYRMGYALYTWWEDAQNGRRCDGKTAVWKLLRLLEQPFLFRDSKKSDRIYLPLLPAPPLLERGLVHASGKAGMLLSCENKDGIPVNLIRYDGIRSCLRLEIPRILLGLPDTLNSHHCYQPLENFIDC